MKRIVKPKYLERSEQNARLTTKINIPEKNYRMRMEKEMKNENRK